MASKGSVEHHGGRPASGGSSLKGSCLKAGPASPACLQLLNTELAIYLMKFAPRDVQPKERCHNVPAAPSPPAAHVGKPWEACCERRETEIHQCRNEVFGLAELAEAASSGPFDSPGGTVANRSCCPTAWNATPVQTPGMHLSARLPGCCSRCGAKSSQDHWGGGAAFLPPAWVPVRGCGCPSELAGNSPLAAARLPVLPLQRSLELNLPSALAAVSAVLQSLCTKAS